VSECQSIGSLSVEEREVPDDPPGIPLTFVVIRVAEFSLAAERYPCRVLRIESTTASAGRPFCVCLTEPEFSCQPPQSRHIGERLNWTSKWTLCRLGASVYSNINFVSDASPANLSSQSFLRISSELASLYPKLQQLIVAQLVIFGRELCHDEALAQPRM
jgi:hypothetical protein